MFVLVFVLTLLFWFWLLLLLPGVKVGRTVVVTVTVEGWTVEVGVTVEVGLGKGRKGGRKGGRILEGAEVTSAEAVAACPGCKKGGSSAENLSCSWPNRSGMRLNPAKF